MIFLRIREFLHEFRRKKTCERFGKHYPMRSYFLEFQGLQSQEIRDFAKHCVNDLGGFITLKHNIIDVHKPAGQ